MAHSNHVLTSPQWCGCSSCVPDQQFSVIHTPKLMHTTQRMTTKQSGNQWALLTPECLNALLLNALLNTRCSERRNKNRTNPLC
jgi:hypothetical protein